MVINNPRKFNRRSSSVFLSNEKHLKIILRVEVYRRNNDQYYLVSAFGSYRANPVCNFDYKTIEIAFCDFFLFQSLFPTVSKTFFQLLFNPQILGDSQKNLLFYFNVFWRKTNFWREKTNFSVQLRS